MTVLTEEMLARAEQIYLMALARRAGLLGGYDEEGGISAERQRELMPGETKWLT